MKNLMTFLLLLTSTLSFGATNDGLSIALDSVEVNCPKEYKQLDDLRNEILQLGRDGVLEFPETSVFLSAANGMLATQVHTGESGFKPAYCKLVYGGQVDDVRKVLNKFLAK